MGRLTPLVGKSLLSPSLNMSVDRAWRDMDARDASRHAQCSFRGGGLVMPYSALMPSLEAIQQAVREPLSQAPRDHQAFAVYIFERARQIDHERALAKGPAAHDSQQTPVDTSDACRPKPGHTRLERSVDHGQISPAEQFFRISCSPHDLFPRPKYLRCNTSIIDLLRRV
jgi:hypothetical protein